MRRLQQKRRRLQQDAVADAAPTAAAARVDGKGALERKLLAATAGLLGAREEAAGLRREVSSLQALVARLREDEVCGAAWAHLLVLVRAV